MTICIGREIWVIGPNQLHNELLGHFLTCKTGATCMMAEALGSVERREVESEEQKRLVLYDFSSRGQTVEELIAADVNNILKTDYVVLINLTNLLNIEIEALQCGVRGFLYYQGGLDVLVKMIQTVLDSQLWISRELISELLLLTRLKHKNGAAKNAAGLSQREVAIVTGIVKGLTNAEIADRCCLSPHTVKTHIHHIFRKLNVSNRLQAAQWASENLRPAT